MRAPRIPAAIRPGRGFIPDRVVEGGPVKVGVSEVRSDEIRPIEARPGEVRAHELRTGEVRRAKVGSTQVRALQVTLGQIRPPQVRVSKALPPQVHAHEAATCEVSRRVVRLRRYYPPSRPIPLPNHDHHADHSARCARSPRDTPADRFAAKPHPPAQRAERALLESVRVVELEVGTLPLCRGQVRRLRAAVVVRRIHLTRRSIPLCPDTEDPPKDPGDRIGKDAGLTLDDA
jgi:hypothetical protein